TKAAIRSKKSGSVTTSAKTASPDLEKQLQRQFNRPACVESRSDLAARAGVDCRARRGKGRMVEDVEELGAELQGLRFGEPELLGNGEIELHQVVGAQDVPSGCSISILSRDAERIGRARSGGDAAWISGHIEPAGDGIYLGRARQKIRTLRADA